LLALILDEEGAYYYARDEILAMRHRVRLEPPPAPSYKDWYLEYLQSPEWRARAEAAKARFGYRCGLCNVNGPLETHHRTYERVGNELPEDLVPLCADCHGAYHRWRLGRV
jgi:5-methylcytosine-specific restriction endonuclease McrA